LFPEAGSTIKVATALEPKSKLFPKFNVTVKEEPTQVAVADKISGVQQGESKKSKALYKGLESKCLTKAKIDLLIAEGFL
jgi:hypothetical protein